MSTGLLAKRIAPPKLKAFRDAYDQPVAILDVGCGNHSPSITRHWFPRSSYYGLDITDRDCDPADRAAMNGFYELDLQRGDLDCVPDGGFDIIIMAHVIEHITNGEEVIQALGRKLKPSGRIYVECPSERSLTLPSAAGTLNFRDDPTHVRFYSLTELTRACLNAGLVVQQRAVRRDKVWMAVGLLLLPRHLIALLRHRKLFGPALWDFLGFAHFVTAQRES
ncbi:MAG TPA: class I SAM-dependent methyltransferase [Terriglobales bacterium]|nr:class I SAM-dependent methyltransferase [Terriglobales bacterium]